MAARALQSDTRAAVLGDLVESRESVWRALIDVLGLVVRQQLFLLKNWQPWLAVFGLALPGCLVLMGLSVSVSSALQHLSHNAADGASLPNHESLLQLLCPGLLLLGSAWTCGFAMGSMARKTLWVVSVACCFPCLLCLGEFREPSLSRLCLFLFLLPAVAGVRQALRGTRVGRAAAFLLATAVTALAILLANGKGFWTINWVLIWPAWYVVAASQRDSRKPQPI